MPSQLSSTDTPNTGDVFTLSFAPTGLGNPFDNAQDWYAIGGNSAGLFEVTDVNFHGNFFANNEIDVTVVYSGGVGAIDYADIAAMFTSALSNVVWGYTFLGAFAGANQQVPTNQNDLSLGSIGIPTSTVVLFVVLALVALFFVGKVEQI